MLGTYRETIPEKTNDKPFGEIHLILYVDNDGVMRGQWGSPKEMQMTKNAVIALAPGIIVEYKNALELEQNIVPASVIMAKIEYEKQVEP